MSERYRGKSWRVASVLLALVTVSPTIARAQGAPAGAEAPMVDEKTASAKRHFKQAVALYNDGNFEAALAEFRAAYETKPAASVLYNIGLTYKALFLYNDSILTLKRYLKDESTLAPERRAEVEQILAEMNALLAKTNLAIAPDGAVVKLDGRTIGRAPIGEYLVPAGRHVLEISADGYTTQTKELMITAGVDSSVAMSLQIIPKTGKLHVEVFPIGASAKIDGRVFPPPVDVELPLGGHTLEVWGTGYVTHREEILVAAGQTRSVSVILKKPPITKRAAFIAPIVIGSILVVGAAVGVPLALYERNKNSIIDGTLAPGSFAVGH